ncbi:hypothetical protein [Caudoviricetes sp.]|nr:hypothetical protein [Caudoviricetes sp.]
MAITKQAGRQEVISAKVGYTFSDLVSGTAVSAINLPANARILDVTNRIEVAFNSVTTDALVIRSNEGTPKNYISVSAGSGALSTGLVSKAATGASSNVGFLNPLPSTIDVLWTGAGAITTGTGTLVVDYVVENRAAFSQG